MMSTTAPLELKTSVSESYSCLKTELTLSLPGSDESNPVLGLSLFDQQTQPNTNVYSFDSMKSNNNGGRDLAGKRGFADASGKWGLSVNGGSECEVGKCAAALFSHRVSTKSGQLEDMDIDAASASQKFPKPVNGTGTAPAAKAQVVGWPPIRSFRKNSVASASAKNSNGADGKSVLTCLYVKVSMDGAPYLRKVDLKLYKNYKELSLALKKMFSGFSVGKDGLGDSHQNDLPHGSECVLTYEDKDGDWMLVGDVPWDMFTSTCKRLRIMKGPEAVGLAPRDVETCTR